MEEHPPRSVLTGANVLLGIDDTDRIDSAGTGHLAERLLRVLQRRGLGRAVAESRHQLLVDARIPYTSHNASSCIAWDGGDGPDLEEIAARAGAILDAESESGSNPGLVVAGPSVWSDLAARRALVGFGHRAKRGSSTRAPPPAWRPSLASTPPAMVATAQGSSARSLRSASTSPAPTGGSAGCPASGCCAGA